MKTLFFTLLFLSFNTYAQSLNERLMIEITKLESKMSARDFKTQAASLLSKDARQETFKLQALGRLFEKDFKHLKRIKDSSKELEDQIGQCAKWDELIKTTSKPENKPTYIKNLKAENAKLATLLSEWKASDKIEDFKFIASDINLDEDETLKLTRKNFNSEIKELLNKKFDFHYGETGLHELRRQVRWPRFYIQIFSDKIYLKKAEKCSKSPNDLFEIGKLKNKLVFKGDPDIESTIVFKDCAYIKLLGAVELMGEIKDELEDQGVLDDKLPKDLRERVVDIYKELVDEVLPKLD